MGFFSRLKEIFAGKQQPTGIEKAKSSTPTSVSSPSAAPAKPVANSEPPSAPPAPVEVVSPPSVSSDTSLELHQQILAWGESRQGRQIPQVIRYGNHSDKEVRQAVAIALGNLVEANPKQPEIQQAIPVLGKLSHDRQPEVSRYAVEALGLIRSETVLPYLRSAAKSPISSVSKAASKALQQLKLHYRAEPEVPVRVNRNEKPETRF